MIDRWGIRARVLLVALLPMLVVAILLTTFYTRSRLDDLETTHAAHGKAFARQLVAASEYAVFSGNHEALRSLAEAAMGEDSVTGIRIVDLFGDELASVGRLAGGAARHVSLVDQAQQLQIGTTLRIIEPIVASWVNLDDGFLQNPVHDLHPLPAFHPVLGNVIVDIDRRPLDEQRRALLRTGVTTVIVALLGTLALAMWMSHGVSAPVRRVARAVERIGQGDFDARVPPMGGGSLRMLTEGVNRMAAELSDSHARMNERIESATAELRARTDEAEQANRAKSRFLAAASHDLRQPMHALGLFIAELAQRPHAPGDDRLIRQIAASAHAMEDLLDSLLDISRLDAGALQARPRDLDLRTLLERILASHQATAEDARTRLALRCPQPARVRSDAVLLERILGNLVSNAVRYAPGGRVLIACRQRGRHWRVEVRDNGIGIPETAQELIFQEFVQLQNPERARGKGLGLGLAIVRRLTDLLAHPLELRSRLDEGSTFAVTLPAAASAPAIAPPEQPLPGDLRGTRVALIDDDPLALAATRSLLESWGCDVDAGAELGELVVLLGRRRSPPDIIISDYRLGHHGDGLSVINTLRRLFDEELAAVLITGDTAPDAIARAREAGYPVLHKPVRPARLRALINRLRPGRDIDELG